MNIFYGGKFIKKEDLIKAGIMHPVELEYYKIVNDENVKYGIKVVKKEYIEDDVKSEDKEIKFLSNNEQRTEKLLELLKKNDVTPIAVQDIVQDLRKSISN